MSEPTLEMLPLTPLVALYGGQARIDLNLGESDAADQQHRPHRCEASTHSHPCSLLVCVVCMITCRRCGAVTGVLRACYERLGSRKR